VPSHHAWEGYYGRDPGVLGSGFLIKGKPFTLVGSAQPGFYGETLGSHPPDIWLPVATEPLLEGSNDLLDRPGELWLYVIGRVHPGTSLGALESKVNVKA